MWCQGLPSAHVCDTLRHTCRYALWLQWHHAVQMGRCKLPSAERRNRRNARQNAKRLAKRLQEKPEEAAVRRANEALAKRQARANESAQQTAARREASARCMQAARAAMDDQQADATRASNAAQHREKRWQMSHGQKQLDALRKAEERGQETAEQRVERQRKDRERHACAAARSPAASPQRLFHADNRTAAPSANVRHLFCDAAEDDLRLAEILADQELDDSCSVRSVDSLGACTLSNSTETDGECWQCTAIDQQNTASRGRSVVAACSCPDCCSWRTRTHVHSRHSLQPSFKLHSRRPTRAASLPPAQCSPAVHVVRRNASVHAAICPPKVSKKDRRKMRQQRRAEAKAALQRAPKQPQTPTRSAQPQPSPRQRGQKRPRQPGCTPARRLAARARCKATPSPKYRDTCARRGRPWWRGWTKRLNVRSGCLDADGPDDKWSYIRASARAAFGTSTADMAVKEESPARGAFPLHCIFHARLQLMWHCLHFSCDMCYVTACDAVSLHQISML